jgi:hypothetical protein
MRPLLLQTNLTVKRRATIAGGKRRRKNSSIRNGNKVKRQYRFHPGTVALREIRKLQKSTGLLYRIVPFLNDPVSRF